MSIQLSKREVLIDFLKTNPIFTPLYKTIVQYNLRKWKKNGKPSPPPHEVKKKMVFEISKKYQISTFIETGTFLGHMIYSVKDIFSKIYSIELSHQLSERARKKFKKHNHIKIIEGDSAQQLKLLLEEINERVIFWLDGHFSGGVTAKGDEITPVNTEIEAIAKHKIKDHVILIDDARLFIGTNGYPLLKTFLDYLKSNFPNHSIEVKNDIICIQPN